MLPVAPHKEDIKAEIRKRGSSLAELTRENMPIGDTALTICLDRPLPRANRIIAGFLGLPLNHLWPRWYDKDGKRIPKRSVSKYSRSTRLCRSKKLRHRLTKNGGRA